MIDLNRLRDKFKRLELGAYEFHTGQLRPKSWDEYIGNSDAIDLLKMTLISCKKHQTPLPHTILSGASGSGKTTLAMLIASAQGGDVLSVALPIDFDEWRDLCRQIKPFTVMILDEVHLMKQKPEILYSVIEEGVFISEGQRFSLPCFTAIGATTEYGEIKTPLRNRFTLNIQLAKLSLKEMQMIVEQGARKYGVPITPSASEMIAGASNSIPRDACSLLTRCRDLMEALDLGEIAEDVVESTFKLLKVNRMGLTIRHGYYLCVLRDTFKGERVGIRSIAATLGENSSTLELTVEPQLLNLGLVVKTSRGRMITEKGKDYLDSKEMQEILREE